MNAPVNVVIIKRFTAPAARVFDAWLDPSFIGRWMFGPAVRNEQIVRLGNEPRVGGKYSYVVQRGDQQVDHLGEYLELERPRRLVFTWATRDSLPDTSRVTIEITALDDGCELKLTHELAPNWSAYAERTQEAWTKMLDTLAGVLG